eukprot:TRINITY_DN885_c0_g1_i2.p1 TRINITY_DN885_c0_g1~~TRINITY_DN885_c0_g1_i2.p1  ORF type:complete len:485 (+),score=116.17 TRINITY_DN885_c0_g1_i2:1990-3444(+)
MSISSQVIKMPKPIQTPPLLKSKDWNKTWARDIDDRMKSMTDITPYDREDVNFYCSEITSNLLYLYNLARVQSNSQNQFVKSTKPSKFHRTKDKRKQLLKDKSRELHRSPRDVDYINKLASEIKICDKILLSLRRKHQRKKTRKHIDEMLKKDNFDSQIIFKLLKGKTASFSPHFVLKDDKKFYTPRTPPPQEDFEEYLEYCPTIPDTHQTNYTFHAADIQQVLTDKKNTSPAKNNATTIFERLETLYTACYKLGVIPTQWEEDNWRPITLLSTLYKGFTTMLNSQMMSTIEQFELLPWNQFGFRKNHNTSMPIMSLMKMISIASKNKAPFEVVHIKRGVKQGDPLSPTLFALCLAPLSILLSQNDKFRNHFLFADDLAAWFESHKEFKQLHKSLTAYIPHLTLELNLSKSATTSMNMEPFKGTHIPHLPPNKSYKYLGVPINLELNHKTSLNTTKQTLRSRLKLLESKSSPSSSSIHSHASRL